MITASGADISRTCPPWAWLSRHWSRPVIGSRCGGSATFRALSCISVCRLRRRWRREVIAHEVDDERRPAEPPRAQSVPGQRVVGLAKATALHEPGTLLVCTVASGYDARHAGASAWSAGGGDDPL